MRPIYRLLADCVAIVHLSYIGFVVIGFILIVIGILRQWNWVRSCWFRSAHLLAIALVCAESLVGIGCPLTTLESRLLAMAGAVGYSRGFVGYWSDRLIFYNFSPWVFVAAYTAFALTVAAVFVIAPPRPPQRRSGIR
jgi:hypothetical protein